MPISDNPQSDRPSIQPRMLLRMMRWALLDPMPDFRGLGARKHCREKLDDTLSNAVAACRMWETSVRNYQHMHRTLVLVSMDLSTTQVGELFGRHHTSILHSTQIVWLWLEKAEGVQRPYTLDRVKQWCESVRHGREQQFLETHRVGLVSPYLG